MASEAELRHFSELIGAVEAAPVRTTPNPRVGCRILAADGRVAGEGVHGTAGVDHAEVIALAQAGAAARGGTALVTLEPCNHTGRTAPCSLALISAGISRVVYAVADPTAAAGGADRLRQAGIEVEFAPLAAAADLVEPWMHFQATGRPFVTLKLAATLDGYVAARDGSSRWITGEAAREYSHRLRSRVDAIAVGTGTVFTDDPGLDVRLPGEWPQPRIFVFGSRPIPAAAKLAGRSEQISDPEPAVILNRLAAQGVQHLLIEGGAKLAAAWLRSGAIDQLLWFTAPKLLGAGKAAVGDLGIGGISGAIGWQRRKLLDFGGDVAFDLRRESADR